MIRTNDTWIEHLGASGALQTKALEDLRSLLVRRLLQAFRERSGVDENFLEDMAQQSLLKTLESLDQFQGKSKFTTWVTSISVRTTLTELRRRHWKDVSLNQVLENDSTAKTTEPEAPIASPETLLEKKDLIAKMHQIMKQDLTEKQHNVLLAELQGMPLEEIARRTGSNRNAIYKLTHDARKRLKSGLEDAGYNLTDVSTAYEA